MQFNKESNGFIIGFVAIMVVVVSVSLSLISSGLKPLKDKNEIVDKKSKILKSVVDVNEEEEKKLFTAEFVLNEYNSNIQEIVIDQEGNIIGENAFEIDFKKETRKPAEQRSLPVFIYTEGTEKYYIIPLIGLGLWDEISGYLAVEDNFNTIRGAAFDHKGETPGLGARIVDYWFRKQFKGKKLFNNGVYYSFHVLKGEGHPDKGEFEVDGLSGATLTTQGVNAMIEKCVDYYRNYFEKEKSSS